MSPPSPPPGGVGSEVGKPPRGGWVGYPIPPGVGGWCFGRNPCTPPPTPAKSWSPGENLDLEALKVIILVVVQRRAPKVIIVVRPGAEFFEPGWDRVICSIKAEILERYAGSTAILQWMPRNITV
jgi:hypothetical protein